MNDNPKFTQFQQFAIGLLRIISADIAVVTDLAVEHDLLRTVVLENPHLKQRWTEEGSKIRQASAPISKLLETNQKIATLLQSIENGSWEYLEANQILNTKLD